MSFYTEMADSAAKIIREFGGKCKVTTVNGETFSVYIVFLPSSKTTNDTYVVEYDKIGYLESTKIQPKPGDIVQLGSEVLVVAQSEGFMPDGKTNLYYKVFLKA